MNAKEARAAIEAAEATAWRPVTEPPEEEGVYLVARRPNEPPHRWLIDIVPYFNNPRKGLRIYEKATQWPCYESTSCPVTHWRPLPQPPTAAGSGKDAPVEAAP